MSTSPQEFAELQAQFYGARPNGPMPSAEVVEAFAGAIALFAADDFVCIMDGGALTTRYEGIAGLREGWTDFLGAFETVKVEPVEVTEFEGGLLEFVRLIGKPNGVDADVAQDAAAVWRFEDGELACVEFHLDRARARASAGLD